MVFERSTDYAAIRELLIEPRCFRRMTGGQGPARASLDVGPREGFEFFTAMEHDQLAAVFLLATSGEETEIHLCFAPHTWGRSAPIFVEFVRWVWRNTDHARLIGPVPNHNRLAVRLALAAGFTPFASARGFDEIVFEVRKPCPSSAP
jgi:hypothetical protein